MVAAVFAIILTLLLVVGVHEIGHALMARFFLIKIKRISIGFGRPLLQWTSPNGIEWVWAMWPLGGYVELLNSRISPVDPQQYPFCFDKKPVWQRIVVLVAGSMANLIGAWLAFLFVFLLGISDHVPEVQTVHNKSTAAQAGFKPGDRILAIASNPTPQWREVGMQLLSLWGQKNVPVLVRHSSGDEHEVLLDLSTVALSASDKSLLDSIGIAPNKSAPVQLLKASSLADAIYLSNHAIYQWLHFFMLILKQLILGIIPFSLLLGPIGLFAASIQSFVQGLVVFLYFIASLSLAVGLVNLFPIPGLDGGSILYALIEKLRKKPISVALEILLYRLVLIICAVALVQLLMNDLQRVYGV